MGKQVSLFLSMLLLLLVYMQVLYNVHRGITGKIYANSGVFVQCTCRYISVYAGITGAVQVHAMISG